MIFTPTGGPVQGYKECILGFHKSQWKIGAYPKGVLLKSNPASTLKRKQRACREDANVPGGLTLPAFSAIFLAMVIYFGGIEYGRNE